MASKVLANYSRTPTARLILMVCQFSPTHLNPSACGVCSLVVYLTLTLRSGTCELYCEKPGSNMQKLKSHLGMIFKDSVAVILAQIGHRKHQGSQNLNCLQDAGVNKKTRSIRRPELKQAVPFMKTSTFLIQLAG